MSDNEEILNNLDSDDLSEKKKAVFKTGEKKIKVAVPKLIELLKDDEDKVVRNSAARALGKIADEDQKNKILNALEVGLEDPDIRVRANSCWALGKIGDRRAVKLLSKMVDPSQRFYTMSADPTSDQISEAEASDQLKEEGMKSSDVIIAAVKALGRIGDPDAIDALERALDDESDGQVRCAACLAMGKIGSKDATPSLLNALKDQYWYVRRDAAKALKKIKDQRAIYSLESLLDDMYDQVKKSAKKALLAIGEPANRVIFGLFLKNPQDEDYRQYIRENLSRDEIISFIEEYIEKEEDMEKKKRYRAFLKRMGG